MQDHYEILQVQPKADAETIAAAYARLSQQYEPTKLAGVADELVALASEKRRQVEVAYAVLGDPAERAKYDARQARVAAVLAVAEPQPQLDYRPLPPAGGQERDKRAAIRPTPAPLPTMTGRRVGKARPLWFAPTIIAAVLTLTVTVTSLTLTSGVSQAPPPPTPDPAQAAQGGPQPIMPLSEIVAEYDKQAATARQVAEQQQTATAWVLYGNAVYDSVMIVREREPTGELYQQRLPLWLEATRAYSQALQLEPGNAVARSDLGVAYCYYGGDTGDQALVGQGIAEAQQAQQAAPQEARVLLNLGLCLVQEEPPATGEALSYWQQLVQTQPDSPEGQQAAALITRYRE